MKNKSNNIIVFTYNMLYINDLIYNHIINIEKKFKSHNHVETLKIYNGLLKNIEEYYNIINEIIDKHSMAYSNFCGIIDEDIDPLVDNLYESIYELLIQQVDKEVAELLSEIEVTLIICDIASSLFENTKKRRFEFDINFDRIDYLNLTNVHKKVRGLSDWVTFLYRQDVNVNLNNEEKVVKSFKELTSKLVSVNMYANAINRINNENYTPSINKRVMVILNDNDNQKEFYNSISECAKKLNTSRYMIYKCDKTGEKFRKLLTIKILK